MFGSQWDCRTNQMPESSVFVEASTKRTFKVLLSPDWALAMQVGRC